MLVYAAKVPQPLHLIQTCFRQVFAANMRQNYSREAIQLGVTCEIFFAQNFFFPSTFFLILPCTRSCHVSDPSKISEIISCVSVSTHVSHVLSYF